MTDITLSPGPGPNLGAPTSFRTGSALPTLAIIAVSICFGLVPLFVRQLQGLDLSPEAIAFWRFAFTGLLVLPFLPWRRRVRGQALLLAGAGLLMGLGWVGYMTAMETAPIAVTGVIYMSYPLFTLLFAWLLLKQRPTGRSWLAAGLVLLAAALVIGLGGDAGDMSGLTTAILALPAPIFFGLIIVVLSTMVPDLTTLEKLAAGMWGSVIGLLPLVLFGDSAAFLPRDGETWMAIAGLGAVTAALPQLIYTIACGRVGPARSAAAGSIELPTMIAIGFFAFSEPVGLIEIGASALVLAAIMLAPAVKPARR